MINLDLWMRLDRWYLHITGVDTEYIYVDNHLGAPSYSIWAGNNRITHEDAQRSYLAHDAKFCESPLDNG